MLGLLANEAGPHRWRPRLLPLSGFSDVQEGWPGEWVAPSRSSEAAITLMPQSRQHRAMSPVSQTSVPALVPQRAAMAGAAETVPMIARSMWSCPAVLPERTCLNRAMGSYARWEALVGRTEMRSTSGGQMRRLLPGGASRRGEGMGDRLLAAVPEVRDSRGQGERQPSQATRRGRREPIRGTLQDKYGVPGIHRPLPLAELVARVCAATGVPPAHLQQGSRRGTVAGSPPGRAAGRWAGPFRVRASRAGRAWWRP